MTLKDITNGVSFINCVSKHFSFHFKTTLPR